MNRKAGKRKEASWRKMLFIQPSISAALVHHGKSHHFHEVRASEYVRGLTLNDVACSAVRFHKYIWTIWVGDGFAKLPVSEDSDKPAKSTGAAYLDEMAKEPMQEEKD